MDSYVKQRWSQFYPPFVWEEGLGQKGIETDSKQSLVLGGEAAIADG